MVSMASVSWHFSADGHFCYHVVLSRILECRHHFRHGLGHGAGQRLLPAERLAQPAPEILRMARQRAGGNYRRRVIRIWSMPASSQGAPSPANPARRLNPSSPPFPSHFPLHPPPPPPPPP